MTDSIVLRLSGPPPVMMLTGRRCSEAPLHDHWIVLHFSALYYARVLAEIHAFHVTTYHEVSSFVTDAGMKTISL